MSFSIVVRAKEEDRSKPLFYYPEDDKSIHESSFITLEGKRISDLTKIAYESYSGGRFSRTQLIKEKDAGGNLQPMYVLKHIKSGKASYILESVKAEIENLKAFKGNPYVVQLLGANVYERDAFLLFPYIPGKTLQEWLKTKPSPDIRYKRYLELWTGLQVIHEKGYVHLDVNPANIWIPDNIDIPAFYLDLGSMHKKGVERNHFRKTITPGYYPQFSSINYAEPYLNFYSFEKILERNDDKGLEESIKAIIKERLNAEKAGFDKRSEERNAARKAAAAEEAASGGAGGGAGGATGGAGAGAGANKGGGITRRKRRHPKRRGTRRN